MKAVSLKSTLSTFWVVLVVFGGFGDLGGSVCLIYVRPISVVGWFAYIYAMAVCLSCWGFGVILNFLHLFHICYCNTLFPPYLVDRSTCPFPVQPSANSERT